MRLDKKTTWKIIGIIAAAAVIFAVCQNMSSVLDILKKCFSIISPFLIGGAIAFIINVPMRYIEKKLTPKLRKFRRPLALILTILAILAVIAIVMLLVVPQLVDTIASLGKQIPEYMTKLQDYVNGLFKDYPEVLEWINELEINWQNILSSVSGWLGSGLSSTISVVSSAVSGVSSFVIGFVFAIYILLQKERLGNQCKMILYAFVPEKHADRTIEILSMASRTFSGFLSGQCLEAVILGCLFAIAMNIARMPYVTLISVLISFTALIPLVGAFIGCIVGALLILMDSGILKAVIFVAMFLVIQQIEGNLIYPKVVGKSVGLPSMWVLFAVTVGMKLMGVFGMLIMIPTASVLYALFREYIVKRLRGRSGRIQKMFFKHGIPVDELDSNITNSMDDDDTDNTECPEMMDYTEGEHTE